MKRICFRVDANSEIGQGHLMRCITIARSVSETSDAEIIFAVSDSNSIKLLEKEMYRTIDLDINYTDYSKEASKKLKAILVDEEIDVLLIDSYSLNNDYVLSIKEVAKVACFWRKESKISADLIINYNIDYNKDFYERETVANQIRLLGAEYVPLRSDFSKVNKNEEKNPPRNILLLTGGSDNLNVLGRFIDHAQEFSDYMVTCVVGKYSKFKETDSTPSNIKVVGQSDHIAQIMMENDIIISAGGTTMYEICSLGIPAIIYSLADNQLSEPAFLNDLGAVIYVGNADNSLFFDKIKKAVVSLSEPKNRTAMIHKMDHLVDGKGAKRIALALMRL